MVSLPARYIQEVGTVGRLRVYWDLVTVRPVEPCDDCEGGHSVREYRNSCKNSYGRGSPGVHNAYSEVGRVAELGAFGAFGRPEDHPDHTWPKSCSHCGEPVPPSGDEFGPRKAGETGVYLVRQVFKDRLYDSSSGRPEPGDIYEVDRHDAGECPHWDDCHGVHVHAVLPNGHEWDVDSRASNCTMREDRAHRCWIRTGSLRDGSLSVGKSGGTTCSAGGGSIAVPGWHGFLTGFFFREC